MHEDAAVDEALLADADRVFAIASAGDTALRLASRGRQVTAVDVHPAQVAYVRARPREGRKCSAASTIYLRPRGW
jgi:S-adenosylmethionine:diacylglycerol 3-amino-3-carboxypropyl transferase